MMKKDLIRQGHPLTQRDLIRKVFCYLHLKQMFGMAPVCKSWNEVTSCPDFYPPETIHIDELYRTNWDSNVEEYVGSKVFLRNYENLFGCDPIFIDFESIPSSRLALFMSCIGSIWYEKEIIEHESDFQYKNIDKNSYHQLDRIIPHHSTAVTSLRFSEGVPGATHLQELETLFPQIKEISLGCVPPDEFNSMNLSLLPKLEKLSISYCDSVHGYFSSVSANMFEISLKMQIPALMGKFDIVYFHLFGSKSFVWTAFQPSFMDGVKCIVILLFRISFSSESMAEFEERVLSCKDLEAVVFMDYEALPFTETESEIVIHENAFPRIRNTNRLKMFIYRYRSMKKSIKVPRGIEVRIDSHNNILSFAKGLF